MRSIPRQLLYFSDDLDHSAPLDQFQEFLRVLADSRMQFVTLVTSRDRLCESDVNVEYYRLPGLDEQAWGQYLEYLE
ncbi:MAG: hypothetical protein AB4426_10235 [Xenococcaceae cyanobacterium]